MASEFTYTGRVEFHETDMAGIVHFSNFFKYMESAEHAFFRSLGLPLHRDEGGEMFGWARVEARATYKRPLKYMDRFEVRLVVREKRSSSFGYELTFRLIERDGSPVEPADVATGELVTVFVRRDAGQDGAKAAPMPDEVRRAIEVAKN